MKSVMITGVTKGIGEALSSMFDQKGWRVIGCGRSQEKIDEMSQKYASHHLFSVVNLTKQDQVQQWVDKAFEAAKEVDLIINNAGQINPSMFLWEVPFETFEQVISVNLTAVFYVIKAAMPHLLKQDRGVIANMSSNWGVNAESKVGPYCASKFAIEGLTKSLAKEMPDHLAAVLLDPGGVRTEMLRSCWRDGYEKRLVKDPLTWAGVAVDHLINLQSSSNGRRIKIEV